MGKVEDVGGVVTQGVGVGKKFSAAFGGQKFTPMGRGGQHVTDLAQNLKNETSIAKSSSLKIIDL